MRMCLARTDPHVPKHQGLTMFIVKIHQPGIEVQRIKMVNGMAEFCQEFFDDVAIPAADVSGRSTTDGRWPHGCSTTSGMRWAVARPTSSGLAMGTPTSGGSGRDLADLARATGQADDPLVRQLVAEARVNDRVQQQLTERVTLGIRTGRPAGPAGATPRLFAATNSERHFDIGLEIAGGPPARGWTGDPAGSWGALYLTRQSRTAWVAGATRCSATSSANGCSACHASTPPTATAPSTRCATTAPVTPQGLTQVRRPAPRPVVPDRCRPCSWCLRRRRAS